MRPFRFSIAEMMVVVVIVAMDLSVFRLLGRFSGPWLSHLLELIFVALCPWPTCWRSGSCMGFINGRGTKT